MAPSVRGCDIMAPSDSERIISMAETASSKTSPDSTDKGKKNIDMTTGSPVRLILQFMLPLFLGNLFQQFYSTADSMIVSRGLGVAAFAGVSATMMFNGLILGFNNGMTNGLAIAVAQKYGAKDYEGIRKQYAHNLLLSVICAVILSAIGLLFGGAALRLLHTPADIFDYALQYQQIIFLGILCSMFYNFLANTLRALGDSRSPFIYLLIASGLNIVMDLVFVFLTPLGVRGAALATVLAQGISALLCHRRILKKMPFLSLKGFRFEPDREMIRQSLGLGLPIGFQSSLISLGGVAIQFAINNMGTASIAAYAAAGKLEFFAIGPISAVSMAVATYTGQNFGAKKYRRILQGLNQTLVLSLCLSAALGAVMWFVGKDLVMLVIGSGASAEILEKSQLFMRVHGVLYPILSILLLYRLALQGMGHTMVPTIAGFMELGARILSAFVIIPRLEFIGASIESPLSWILASIPVLTMWFIVRKDLVQKAAEEAIRPEEL